MKKSSIYRSSSTRSSIYLRNSLSKRELELLTTDLIDHSIQVVSKIKNLSFSKEQIKGIVTKSVDRVLFTYKFGKGGSLGNLVKTQVMADLRDEFTKSYPNSVSKIIWPDLVEKKPFDRLVAVLQKLKTLQKESVDVIFEEMNDNLNGRQQKLLSTLYNTPFITYAEICKQFGTRGVMTYREIKIIYNQLLQTLKFLDIDI
jgi:hypothetical protein